MTAQATAVETEILGYKILERIGAGGYGEVWRAEAPGGLEKAVKIVYGFHTEERAARELKALERVKQVHHPFLLSIERIDVADGKLIIVSELADQSLKDRYDECRKQGRPGIPRDELQTYMQDTADALDYMSQNYSLQHLDVKPENLLIMGGRVKVADFGLVKNLQEATAMSLMAGLTPAFAAPEAFDDRPGRNSDQYSLAIVYVQMLTGTLPFPGRTTAQLAAQHLHSRPILAALPPMDQPIVDRALSKREEERFPSCRHFVDALAQPAGSHTVRHSLPGSTLPLAETQDSDRPSSTERRRSSQVVPTVTAPSAVIVPIREHELAEIEWNREEIGLRPTLFVGIGGTGYRVLCHLRKHFSRRFGDLNQVPCWRTLLIETDPTILSQVVQGDPECSLANDDVRLIPLLKPQEYKERARKFSRWLSRRWIYNVPRSQRTEKMRPLGRLAFVDNAEQIQERISGLLKEIQDPDAIWAAASAARMTLRDATPKIFVISSINGGTGGGIALDLVMAIKALCVKNEISVSGLNAVFLHATQRNVEAREMEIANAYSFLQELYEYLLLGGYPGESSCGFPAIPLTECRPASTYLLSLGDSLATHEFDAATNEVARYLYLDAASPVGSFLDRCRGTAPAEETDLPSDTLVRSFGISSRTVDEATAGPVVAELICRNVVFHWMGKAVGKTTPAKKYDAGLGDERCHTDNISDPQSMSDVTALVEQQFEQWQISLDRFIQGITAHVERELNMPWPQMAAEWVRTFGAAASQEVKRGKLNAVVAQIESLFAPAAENDEEDTSAREKIGTILRSYCGARRGELTALMRDWIVQFLDIPTARYGTTREALAACQSRLSKFERDATNQWNRAQAAMKNLLMEYRKAIAESGGTRRWGRLRAKETPEVPVEDILSEYLQWCLLAGSMTGAAGLAKSLDSNLKALDEKLVEFHRVLNQIADQFHEEKIPGGPHSGETTTNTRESAVQAIVGTALRRKLPELNEQLDAAVQREFLDERGGLQRFLTGGNEEIKELPNVLRRLAHDLVQDAISNVEIASVQSVQGENGEETWNEAVPKFLNSTESKLGVEGGKTRHVALGPTPEVAARMRDEVRNVTNEAVEHATLPENGVVLLREIEQLSIRRMANQLIDGNPHYAKVAERLHTRSDVRWPRLDG